MNGTTSSPVSWREGNVPEDPYDFKMRVLVDGEFVRAEKEKRNHMFGWYEGEEVRLMIESHTDILEIKLDKQTGNVSLRRSGK